jgi:hypothetical protein
VARATRYDTHRLDAVEVTPSGALRVPARLARVGVLTYQDSEGNTWGELVPPETLFAADSMATARGMAVADLHPAQQVTPVTRKGVQVGHVGDDVRRDGDYLASTVYVTDAAEIALVQAGERRDVSCGYTCELDETPGVYDGTPYQRVQRGRVYNHLGLGPEGWGRAGTDVSLRLDSAQQVAARHDAPVARLDSTDSPTGRGSPALAHTARVADGDATMATTKRRDGDEPQPEDMKKADAPKADAEEMVSKKDADAAYAAMEAKHVAMAKTLEGLLADATKIIAELKAGESAEVAEDDVPEAVADSIVSKRLAKLDSAREGARLVAPTVKLDGLMKPREIHAATIAAVMPTMKLDGLSDDGVAGVFAGIVEPAKARAAKRADGGRKVADVLVPSNEQAEAVKRADGADGADSFDPIANQKTALNGWAKRDSK